MQNNIKFDYFLYLIEMLVLYKLKRYTCHTTQNITQKITYINMLKNGYELDMEEFQSSLIYNKNKCRIDISYYSTGDNLWVDVIYQINNVNIHLSIDLSLDWPNSYRGDISIGLPVVRTIDVSKYCWDWYDFLLNTFELWRLRFGYNP